MTGLLLGYGPREVARWLVAVAPTPLGACIADRIVTEARPLARLVVRSAALPDLDDAAIAAFDDQIARANQRQAA